MNSRRINRKGQARHRVGRSSRDAEIDTSDVAALGPDFFAQAIRNPFVRPLKQSTTVRLDADVLAWLRSQGPGYQTRLNAILRAAMLQGAAQAPRRVSSSGKRS
jgi:uncharacterized protein (DUF4415 family)